MGLTIRFDKCPLVKILLVVAFPIVNCLIIPDGLWAQIPPSPRNLKQDAITALEQISTTDRRLQRTLDRAIKDIGRSLEDKGRSLFLDEFRIVPPSRGKEVFRQERRAVKRLRKAIKQDRTPGDIKSALQQIINSLVEVDQEIAGLSIATAQQLVQIGVGNPKKFAKAQREFGKALAETNPRKAIERFKKAWEFSQEVVDGSELVIKSSGDSPDSFSPSLASNTLSATFQIHIKGKRHKDDDRGKKHDRDDDDDDRDNKHGRGYKDDDRSKKYDRDDDDDDGDKKQHGRGHKDDYEKEKDHIILEFIEIIQDASGSIVRTLTTEHPVPPLPRRHKDRFVELTVTSVWDGKNENEENEENEEIVPDGSYSYIAFGNLVEVDSDWRDGQHRSHRRRHRFVKPRHRKGRDHREIEATSFPVTGTILLDNTPPEITATVSPMPNAAGWNNMDATVSFDCTDANSGIATCPSPVNVTSESAGQVIEGTATDAAGNRTTTSVTVNIDKTAPSIVASFSPPPNANGWNNSDVTVNFDCADNTSGVATCPDPVGVTTDGGNQIILVTATDVAGNSTTISVTVNLDKLDPLISASLSPPPNVNGWNNSDVTVTFNCNDAGSGVATCPSPVTVNTEGVDQGLNGTATDVAGNTADTSVTVSLDRTPPNVGITFPATGATLNASPVSVTGNLDDGLSGVAIVDCNGTPAFLSDSTFNCDVSLTDGANSIFVEAIDVAGNIGSSNITVTLARGPVVNITFPENLNLFNSSPITVSGTVDDPDASVVVNGVPALVGTEIFTATGVPLKEGSNIITATATDLLGNVGTSSITVVLDTTPPTVLIDSPLDGGILTESTVTVIGMINDIVTGTVNGDDATVTVNGMVAMVSNRGFVVTDLTLRRGLNTLTATANDMAGNTGSHSINVTFQQLAGQRINLVSGNNQTGIIGTTLLLPLVVSLTDASSNPVTGREVNFSVTRGDGTVSSFAEQGRNVNVVTDTAGQARVFFTLGTRTGAGSQRVTTTATGFVGEVIFSASALPAPATAIKIISGENQRGVVGQLLPHPFVIVVHDQGGNPVGGVPVTFEVLQGEGSFAGQPTVTRTTDSDARAAAVLTLGLQEGINNNIANATFPGLTGFPAVFTASGLAAGNAEDTSVSGVVLDNSNVPIPGATARILGTSLEDVTDDQGQFTIPGTPVGAITLEVDGTTTTRPGTWPVLHFDLTTISGRDNTLGMPIFLLPLDTVNAKVVGGPQDVTLQMANVPGLALTIFANSVTCPDGSSQCLAMITQVHRDKVPMPPIGGAAPRLVWTVQPPGILFDPPARITYPNVDGLAPGQIVDIFSFDHDLGEFVSIGTGTVSEDGSVITSDPGVGIPKAGWGYPRRPPRPTSETESDTCSKAAEDTAKAAEALAITNPSAVPFTNIQACIARKTCAQAKDATLNDAEWAETIVPKFIDRFLRQTGKWPEVLDQCQNPPITSPVAQLFPQTWCARKMAKQHIQNDLGDALTMTGEQLENPLRGCGRQDDWDKVFDNIVECIPEGNLATDPFGLIDRFITNEVNALRDSVRDSCLKKAIREAGQ